MKIDIFHMRKLYVLPVYITSLPQVAAIVTRYCVMIDINLKRIIDFLYVRNNYFRLSE